MASQLTGETTRRRVLAGAPLTERRLDLAGVSTAVLEGGDGPSVVLLHGQGGWAGMWLPVAADLVRTHRVIAPDLPGLGASIAARFAIAHPDRLSRLVLVDAGSLARFRPAPGVLVALVRFIARPTERTQQGFLRQVAVDPARARALLGADAQAYGLELARTPSVRAANRWPLEVIEDAGHLSIERPEAFRAALRSALER